MAFAKIMLPLVLAFIAGAFIYLTSSYRRRYYALKKRTDSTIAYQERELERIGIALHEARKKAKKAEADLLFLKNARNAESGMYGDQSSVKRHTPIERHEAKAAQHLTDAPHRSSEKLFTSDEAKFIYNQNMAAYPRAPEYDITDNYSLKPITTDTPDKPTYQPYVSCGYSDGTSGDSSSSDSGSSSSDSCGTTSSD